MQGESKTPRLNPTAASPRAERVVLFLCTGNYYRSRFAEIVFNALAKQRSLPWRAISRGLDVERGSQWNVGPISPHTLHGLASRGIDVPDPLDMPKQTSQEDLDRAAIVVAINEPEHRPMLENLHPTHAKTTRYWTVSDLDKSGPEEALPRIEKQVESLVKRIIEKCKPLHRRGDLRSPRASPIQKRAKRIRRVGTAHQNLNFAVNGNGGPCPPYEMQA